MKSSICLANWLTVLAGKSSTKAESIAELLLAHCKHHATHAHPEADMLVDWVGRLFFHSRKHKKAPIFIGGRASAQKNIFSKSPGRNWARRPGLGPAPKAVIGRSHRSQRLP